MHHVLIPYQVLTNIIDFPKVDFGYLIMQANFSLSEYLILT